MDTDAPSRRSLWRDLSDGTASLSIRCLIAIILAFVLLGIALIATYLLAALVPAWDRSHHYKYYVGGTLAPAPGVRPTEGLLAVVLLLSGACWLATIIWLFVKPVRSRSMLRPMLLTIGIVAITIVICIAVDSTLRGDQEIVIAGIVFLSIAAVFMVWLLALRSARLGRPSLNPQDKQLDIRCPDCGYRMVGLMETRCPECGKAYTLDQLLGKQDFEKFRGTPKSTPQQMTPV